MMDTIATLLFCTAGVIIFAIACVFIMLVLSVWGDK